MKTKPDTEIILGKQLPHSYLDLMNTQRILEYGENTKDFENNEQESIFFFLKDGGVIQAFGMLKPVTVYYQDQAYPIMGIANVIALEKSKGYGTLVMRAISEYLEAEKKVGLGNTHKVNFVFYKKCGYHFVPGLLERFVSIDSEGNESGTETEDYAMFLYDPWQTLDSVVHGSDRVVIRVPFW